MNIGLVRTGDWPPSESRAVQLARESIDRFAFNHGRVSVANDAVDADQLAQIAAALEVIGNLSIQPGATRQDYSESPVLLDRFRIIEELGTGGFGIVLRAFDPVLQREVALKIPRPERLLSGEAPDILAREAQVAARLNHPGIVRVYEARQMGPIWFIASAYCEGPTLGEWLTRCGAPIVAREAARIVRDISRAVAYAHSRGVLHLDLKPDNVLLELPQEPGGVPVPLVTDFGLAASSERGPVDEDLLGGTPDYMAPEQWAREHGSVGVATDVFALGILLHELLGGRRAPAPRASSVRSSRGRNCGPGRLPLTGTPRDLKAICEKCLNEAPDARYQSAHDVAADLEAFMQSKPVSARESAVLERFQLWARRRRGVAALALAVIVICCTSFVVIANGWRRAEIGVRRLRAEKELHAETSERMRRSLLHLTWVVLENQLEPSTLDSSQNVQLGLLRNFYRDVRSWEFSAEGTEILDVALLAAGHSLRLADRARPMGLSAEQREFSGGLAAWLRVVKLEPNEDKWRRALALHLFAYSVRKRPEGWLWWQEPTTQQGILDGPTREMIAIPYGALLVELSDRPGLSRHPDVTHEMLVAGIKLLEAGNTGAEVDVRSALPLLTAYNRLHRVCRRIGEYGQSEETLEKSLAFATELARQGRGACDFAEEIGEAWSLQARELSRRQDWQGSSEALAEAIDFSSIAVRRDPYDIVLRLRLVDLHRRVGARRAAVDDLPFAIDSYAAAIELLDESQANAPNHRSILEKRARLQWDVAQLCIKQGNRAAARSRLEGAVRDYGLLHPRSEDHVSLWRQAVACHKVLAELYVANGDFQKAEVVQKNLSDMLARLRTAKRRLAVLSQASQQSPTPMSDIVLHDANSSALAEK